MGRGGGGRGLLPKGDLTPAVKVSLTPTLVGILVSYFSKSVLNLPCLNFSSESEDQSST